MIHIDKLPEDVLAACRGRGLADADIEAMSPDTVFDQFCCWVLGGMTWGEKFRIAQHGCRESFVPDAVEPERTDAEELPEAQGVTPVPSTTWFLWLKDAPGEPRDMSKRMVVLAASESDAREVAVEDAFGAEADLAFWRDSEVTGCERIPTADDRRIIIQEYAGWS